MRNQLDKKLIIIGILILLVLIMSGMMAYNKISNKAYQSGFNDANVLINQQITNNLNQYGYIVFAYPINQTSTMNLKLVPQFENEIR